MSKRYKYKYEPHLHTSKMSKCSKASVEDQVSFYAALGYDGVFITDHFIRGNCAVDRSLPWEEQVDMYCSAYDEGVEMGKKYGIKVFFGFEITFPGGADLLVYGLDRDWIKAHPQVTGIAQDEFCDLAHESGGFIVHAHPMRENQNIVMSCLVPSKEDAVEIYNRNCNAFINKMARFYARAYGLPETAGTDNHNSRWTKCVCGYETAEPLNSVEDYMIAVKERRGRAFERMLEEDELWQNINTDTKPTSTPAT